LREKLKLQTKASVQKKGEVLPDGVSLNSGDSAENWKAYNISGDRGWGESQITQQSTGKIGCNREKKLLNFGCSTAYEKWAETKEGEASNKGEQN